jgi:alpha-tubulin suppressor-like RCC1 family protein
MKASSTTFIGWGCVGDYSMYDFSNPIAVAAGYNHSMVLRADGTVINWGWYRTQYSFIPAYVPANLTGVVAIGAGYNHSMAIKNDGTVTAWGDNSYGQTDVPAGLLLQLYLFRWAGLL